MVETIAGSDEVGFEDGQNAKFNFPVGSSCFYFHV